MLQIQQIPITLNYSYPLGSYNIRQSKAEMDVTKHRSELTVIRDPIRKRIDQSASFESMSRYQPLRFSQKVAAEGREAAMEATAHIGDDARALRMSRGEAHVDICQRKMGQRALDTITGFIPVPPTIIWEGGTPTKVDFTPFRMDVNWRVNPRPQVEYERGRFNMNVVQWNRVEIAYTGPANVVTIGSHLRQTI